MAKKGEKKATGWACGFVICKRSRARLPWQWQENAASGKGLLDIHALNHKMFFAVQQAII